MRSAHSCRTACTTSLSRQGSAASRRTSSSVAAARSPGSGARIVSHFRARVPRCRITTSTHCSAISRYVVSFPPVTWITPRGEVRIACSRLAEAGGPSFAVATSGRIPAHAAMTSSSVSSAAGKNRLQALSR
jgi:hypothetical protein